MQCKCKCHKDTCIKMYRYPCLAFLRGESSSSYFQLVMAVWLCYIFNRPGVAGPPNFFIQSGGATRCRVCYQQGIPRLVSHSCGGLHCSPIVHMNHMQAIFQDLSFHFTKLVPKDHNKLVHFCHRGGTNFLVLAHTLICGRRLLDSDEVYRSYWI